MPAPTETEEPKLYTKSDMSRAVQRRLAQVKSEPSGLALVVADLVERVRVLEERLADKERP